MLSKYVKLPQYMHLKIPYNLPSTSNKPMLRCAQPLYVLANTLLDLEVPFTKQSQGPPSWAPSLGTPKSQALLCPNGCLRGKAGQRALPTEGLLQSHVEPTSLCTW